MNSLIVVQMFGPAAVKLSNASGNPKPRFTLVADVPRRSAPTLNSWNNLFICNDLRAVAMAAEVVQHQTSDFFILEHPNISSGDTYSLILHKCTNCRVDVYEFQPSGLQQHVVSRS